MVASIAITFAVLMIGLGGAIDFDWTWVDAQVSAALDDPSIVVPTYFVEDFISFRYLISRRFIYVNLTADDILFVRKPLKAFSEFDWVVYPDRDPIVTVSKVDVQNPSTVLCYPTRLAAIVERLDALPPLSEGIFRSLVIAGDDRKMSTVMDDINAIVRSRKFTGIWFAAKDVAHPHVRTAPDGFQFFYLLRAGMANVLAAAQRAADSSRPPRHLVCAAWGAVYSSLDRIVQSRKSLISYLESNKDWVTRSHWSYTEYWENLGNYKFMFVPEGNGVQMPKYFECWLVRTIPITISNFVTRDLQQMGFPFVLVDSWSDISSPEHLEAIFVDISRTIDWYNVLNLLHLRSFMHVIRSTSTITEPYDLTTNTTDK